MESSRQGEEPGKDCALERSGQDPGEEEEPAGWRQWGQKWGQSGEKSGNGNGSVRKGVAGGGSRLAGAGVGGWADAQCPVFWAEAGKRGQDSGPQRPAARPDLGRDVASPTAGGRELSCTCQMGDSLVRCQLGPRQLPVLMDQASGLPAVGEEGQEPGPGGLGAASWVPWHGLPLQPSPPKHLTQPRGWWRWPRWRWGAARLQEALEGPRAPSTGRSCCLSHLVN